MSVLTREALQIKIDEFITSNANNQITGAQVNELFSDVSDSLLNTTSDSGLLASNLGTAAEFEAIFTPGLTELT